MVYNKSKLFEIHYEEVSLDDTADEDDKVHCLKAGQGKGRQGKSKFSQMSRLQWETLLSRLQV